MENLLFLGVPILKHFRVGIFLHVQMGLSDQPEHPQICVNHCHFIGIEGLNF